MPKEAYGTTQIKDVRFSNQEVRAIVLENLKARSSTPYDFDYDHPIVMETESELIFRFVQQKYTKDTDLQNFTLAPLKK